MSLLYLYNCGFEQELASGHPWPLHSSMTANAVCSQLQYLPFLIANPSDWVAVDKAPDKSYFEQLKNEGLVQSPPSPYPIASRHSPETEDFRCWALTPKVEEWAFARGLRTKSPSWDVLEKVNSKAYSYSLGPPLPESALLHSEEDLLHWLKKTPLPAVLKQRFGVAGGGKTRVTSSTPSPSLTAFCNREWEKGQPIVAEPWVQRESDFSSQWTIDRSGVINLLGVTHMNNSPSGVFKGTRVLCEDPLSSLVEAHLTSAQTAVDHLSKVGYWGHVGVDAMIYRWHSDLRLHPIVEINARLTMSAFALLFRNKHFPNGNVELSYTRAPSAQKPLLPKTFPYQLYLRSW